MPHTPAPPHERKLSCDDFGARLDRFEDAWRSQTPPSIDDYLVPPDADGPQGFDLRELLRELIMIDIDWRWRPEYPSGDPILVPGPLPRKPKLEHYISGFPELGAIDKLPFDLIRHELQVRNLWGDAPSKEEYLERFPSHSDSLEAQFRTKGRSIAATTCEIRCESCQGKIEAQPDSSFGYVVCPKCGHQMSLVPVASVGAGDRIANFVLVRKIGEGAFGDVWEAEDQNIRDRRVALKLPTRNRFDPDHLNRCLQEAQAASRLNHPNIVTVYAAGIENGAVYIASELIQGGNLKEYLRRSHRTSGKTAGRFTSREAADKCKRIAEALQHTHQKGIIHRDVKPANILIDEKNGEKPLITDFGLAREEKSQEKDRQKKTIVGTLPYMAPEQARGKANEADARSDVYSLGAVLYELLTERPVFAGDGRYELINKVLDDRPLSPRTFAPKLSHDLEAICLKCLEKKPEQRYPSAQHLADDLGRYLEGRPVKARRTPAFERLGKWARRRPAAAMLCVVSSIAIVSIAAGGWALFKLEADKGARQAEAAEKREAESIAIANTKREVEKLVEEANELVKQNNFALARAKFDEALRLAKRYEKLTRIKEDIEKRIAEVQNEIDRTRRNKVALNQYEGLLSRFDNCVFLSSQISGLVTSVTSGESADPIAARNALRDALNLAGVDWSSMKPLGANWNERWPEKKAGRAKAAVYELLLMLAHATLQATSDQEDPIPEAKQVLALLDWAHQLKLVAETTRAYHFQRADCHGVLRDTKARQKELDIAANTPVNTALDHFLTGKRLVETQYDALDKQSVNFQLAVGHFEAALKEDPDHFWARYYLAVASLRRGQLSEARIHLSFCIAHQPELVWPYILRGFVNGQLDNFAAAKKDFVDAARLCADDDNARYFFLVSRGVVRKMQYDYQRKHQSELGRVPDEKLLDDAAADFEAAINLKEGEFQAYVNLAAVRAMQGDYEDAEDLYTTAIQMRPGLAQLYRVLAEFHINIYRLDEDVDHLDKAVTNLQQAIDRTEDVSTRADDWTRKGQIRVMQQERTKARAAFDKAIDLAPDSPDAHLWKALLILDRKPLDRKQFYEAHASFNDYFRHLNGKRPKVEALLGRAIARFRLVTRDEAPQKSGDDGDPEEHRNDILSGAIEDFDSALQLLRIEEKKTSAALESEMLIAAKDKLDMRLKELQKHRVMAFAYRGLLYSLFGSPRIARYDFARAISLGENGGIKSAVAHVGRGLFDAHKREKKWRDSAQQDANDAVEDTEDMSPDDRRGILLNAARIYAIIVKNLHYGPGSGLTYQTYRRAYPQYQSDGVALLKQALDLTRQEKQAWLWNDIIAKDPYFRSLRKHIDYLRLQKTYGTQEVKKR